MKSEVAGVTEMVTKELSTYPCWFEESLITAEGTVMNGKKVQRMVEVGFQRGPDLLVKPGSVGIT